MRPISFKSDRDLKKLDESKLRLALCQYRETLVLMDYQLGGENRDEQMERQVKEFSEELDGIIAELHRRQEKSPKLVLHKREPLRTAKSENIRPPSSTTRPRSYPSLPFGSP